MGTGRTCPPCRSSCNLRVSLSQGNGYRSRPRGSDPVPTRRPEADGSHQSRQEETFSCSRATVLVQDFRCALPDVRVSEPDTGRAGTGGHCTAEEQTPSAMNTPRRRLGLGRVPSLYWRCHGNEWPAGPRTPGKHPRHGSRFWSRSGCPSCTTATPRISTLNSGRAEQQSTVPGCSRLHPLPRPSSA